MRKVLFLLALVLAGCRHGDSYYEKAIQNPCDVGPVPSRGFACIDAGLNPKPDPVHQQATKWIHFFLAGGDELQVTSDILEHTGHQGGHAWGQVKASAVPHQRYKYNILDVTTGKHNDPEVMIDP